MTIKIVVSKNLESINIFEGYFIYLKIKFICSGKLIIFIKCL
jgi:hypothetical protein